MCSHGGLAYPSKAFMKDIHKANMLFDKFHEKSFDGLSREPGVINNMTDVLKDEFPDYDPKLLRRYVTARTHFRLRNLKLVYKKHIESLRSKNKKNAFAY